MMGNKELGEKSSHQKSTWYFWFIRSQTEASWKRVEKAYSHLILFQSLWFTSDIASLHLWDRALQTMKWLKWLCRVSLETIKFRWESTQAIRISALSWSLWADAWIWIPTLVSSVTSNQLGKLLSPRVRTIVHVWSISRKGIQGNASPRAMVSPGSCPAESQEADWR